MTDELEYLVGKGTRKIDDKYRIGIPLSIWKDNGWGYVYMKIKKDNQDFVDIIPELYFEKFFAPKYLALDIYDEKREEFFDSLRKINIDSQNRITLPKEVRSKIKNEKSVSFTGIGDAIRVKF